MSHSLAMFTAVARPIVSSTTFNKFLVNVSNNVVERVDWPVFFILLIKSSIGLDNFNLFAFACTNKNTTSWQ